MSARADGTALEVTEGALRHGMPYMAFGSGRPLVLLRWFTPDHANPTGWMRKSELKQLAGLARRFRVYAVGRAPGTAAGATMADLATQHAEALQAEFGEPVDVLGVSSGGSIALQLAADHPAVVRRLVVVSSAARLDPAARVGQRRYAEAVLAGRRGLHHMAPATVVNPVGARMLGAAMWLFDPLARPKVPADTHNFLLAEDGFDVTERLGEISVPTLVVAGERDAFYSTASLRRTAEGIPDAQLILYPRTGHMGVVSHPKFVGDIVRFLQT
ncbi:alpha/beta fold hydrolase [Nocardia cyriacigeorgica]|uniref:Alpha/beta fold hydrolase n=2 Tax=Nocardia cyriacigeorgica TaxID=135487 RepID=A0A6P1D4L9_9NOCA|nr:alpha/beta hydrolase [Nocardia cyriacigeorgica]NEW37511.1 alpha/beta fold hydrolase [Nocardia cyriacigeorgica]NEW44988.1 alpha/beta fold hydrolase [Nocardia cyriacigeorgica]NEW49101.1 alpha/beta fold hydrolase [Nocardia cyriacigeorgica]NEW56697.1 alpha/beta fold hydrolase [Nocardia cyriacigeorgica]